MADKLTTDTQLRACAQAAKDELDKIERLPAVTAADNDKILRVVGGKWVAEDASALGEEKTESDVTVSGATVTVPAGRYTSEVQKSVAAAEQAAPCISVSSGGLITASAAQDEGYVSAGTKSATKQLTVQGAKTYTPTTADQVIASGRYLTGAQTIKGDPNFLAENIRDGISMFGKTGTYAGGGAKTYTLKATIKGVVVTIEVVRYYKADGSQYDFISGVKADDPIEVYSNEECVASSVINVDGYTGTVKSGVLDYGTLESAGESDEYATYAYVADISIVNGKVSLNTSSEGASDIAVYLDYSIVSVPLITFDLMGTTYTAKSGMTWYEWRNSEYYTDDVLDDFAEDGEVCTVDGAWIRDENSDDCEYGDSVIREGIAYTDEA